MTSIIQTIGTIERAAHEIHQCGDSMAVGSHPQSVDGKDRDFIIVAIDRHAIVIVS